MPRTLPLTVLFAFLVGCETQEAITSNDNQGPELSVERLRESQTSPIEFEVFNPCSTDGTDEFILISGTVVSSQRFVRNPSGNFVRQEDGAFRAVSGVGLSSGRRYRVLSKDKIISHVFKNGVDIEIFSHTLHIIGQGPGANVIIKGQLQVTFHPDGPATVHVQRNSFECRG